MALTEFQLSVATLALSAAPHFALAGSGALQLHGIGERPTDDVDLFTNVPDELTFAAALSAVVAVLEGSGLVVLIQRSSDQYAKLLITSASTSDEVEADLGYDWRAHDPVFLEVGPVLDRRDAVGNKVAAVFSRSETRDFVDLDAIRRAGIWSDTELVELATERDAGFDEDMFKAAIAQAVTFADDRLLRSGVRPDDLAEFRVRLSTMLYQPRIDLSVGDRQINQQGRAGAGAPKSSGGQFLPKSQGDPEITL